MAVSLQAFYILPTSVWADGPSRFAELTAREGSARVYVYREKKMMGFGARPMLRLDGKEIAPLRNGSYLAMYVTPGKHTVNVKMPLINFPLKSCSREIEVVGGETLFLHYVLDGEFLVISPQMVGSEWTVGLEMIPEQQSRRLIAPLELGGGALPDEASVPRKSADPSAATAPEDATQEGAAERRL
jgi:hypothetical protein